MSLQGLLTAIMTNDVATLRQQVFDHEIERQMGGPDKGPALVDTPLDEGRLAGYYPSHLAVRYRASHCLLTLGTEHIRRLNQQGETPRQILLQQISEEYGHETKLTHIDHLTLAAITTLLSDKEQLDSIFSIYQAVLNKDVKVVALRIAKLTVDPTQSLSKLNSRLTKLLKSLATFEVRINHLLAKFSPLDTHLQTKLSSLLPQFIDQVAEVATSAFRTVTSLANRLIAADPTNQSTYQQYIDTCYQYSLSLIRHLKPLISSERTTTFTKKLILLRDHKSVQNSPTNNHLSQVVAEAKTQTNVTTYDAPTSAFDHRMKRGSEISAETLRENIPSARPRTVPS